MPMRFPEVQLAIGDIPETGLGMGLPTGPVTFTAEQVGELSKKLSTMRHNVNNNLALMVAAMEILRRKPESAIKMADNISSQTNKLIEEIRVFSTEFEQAFGITRETTTSFFEAPPEIGQ
jgi:hypothetical protein